MNQHEKENPGSLVQVDAAELDLLISQNADLKAENGLMRIDLQIVAKALQNIKTLVSGKKPGMGAIMKLTSDLVSGKLKIDNIDELLAIAEKYQPKEIHG
ncbi:MAG: hypothetical protein ACXVIY_00965 [Mucilaginibacter sp.]